MVRIFLFVRIYIWVSEDHLTGLVQCRYMRHFGEIQFSDNLKITGKNTQFKIELKSEV